MTVKQLINELKKFPQDLPVTTWSDIDWKSRDDPHHISVTKKHGHIVIIHMIKMISILLI